MEQLHTKILFERFKRNLRVKIFLVILSMSVISSAYAVTPNYDTSKNVCYEISQTKPLNIPVPKPKPKKVSM